MDNYFNNMYLVNLIIKWRKHLIIIVSLAIILSVIFSAPFFIKPKYKSTAIIYPSNLISYSTETVTEQMLQIFRSDDIRTAVINKLKLKEHYEIDTTKRFYQSKLIKEFERNVSIRKTEFESVELEVLDTDPNMACTIVNTVINEFNLKVKMLFRDKKQEVVTILKNQLDKIITQRDTVQSRLNVLRTQYNILDYKAQVREATKESVKKKDKTSTASVLLKNLETKGGEFEMLESQLAGLNKYYQKVKVDYENELKDLTKELTYTNLVNKPFPADKKAYPVRWLIVAICALGSLIISILLIMSVENFNRYRKHLVIEN